jgi:hypothetical protein
MFSPQVKFHCSSLTRILGAATGVLPVQPGGDARLFASKLPSTAVTIARSRLEFLRDIKKDAI